MRQKTSQVQYGVLWNYLKSWLLNFSWYSWMALPNESTFSTKTNLKRVIFKFLIETENWRIHKITAPRRSKKKKNDYLRKFSPSSLNDSIVLINLYTDDCWISIHEQIYTQVPKVYVFMIFVLHSFYFKINILQRIVKR